MTVSDDEKKRTELLLSVTVSFENKILMEYQKDNVYFWLLHLPVFWSSRSGERVQIYTLNLFILFSMHMLQMPT